MEVALKVTGVAYTNIEMTIIPIKTYRVDI